MKTIFFALILALHPLTLPAQTDAEVEARMQAYALGGAFQNDGFKLRDSHVSGVLQPGETKRFAVNLYFGNSYWFILGRAEQEQPVELTVHNDEGIEVVADRYTGEPGAAALVEAQSSGKYILTVHNPGGKPLTGNLSYAYK